MDDLFDENPSGNGLGLWKRLTEVARRPKDLTQGAIDALTQSYGDTPVADAAGATSSLARALMGALTAVVDVHIPPELIGGCCPRILGEEESIVWNTAAEAVDSERIHLAWSAMGDKIWYLAVRSSEMGSHANTWCPLASLLPGMKDSIVLPVIYTYSRDESATMMTLTADSLQIHRGTTSVIRAKSERMARELGNASVIDLIPDRIEKLTPVPWYSLSLFEDRARRVLGTLSVVGALAICAVAVLLWFGAAMSMISTRADFDRIKQNSEAKTVQLMKSVQVLRSSPMREQLARFSDVNDGLIALNGFLDIYQIKANKVLWRAVLPANVTSNRISELGGMTLETSPQGVIVGNSKEALALGKR